jgi:hypothetical protein
VGVGIKQEMLRRGTRGVRSPVSTFGASLMFLELELLDTRI